MQYSIYKKTIYYKISLISYLPIVLQETTSISILTSPGYKNNIKNVIPLNM